MTSGHRRQSLAAALFCALLTTANPSSGTAEEYNSATYDSIAAQAKQVSGPPLTITSNYWLAWTGAWDTVVMKETKLWEQWLPKGTKIEWRRNLQGPPVITDLLANKQQIGYIGDNPSIVSTTKREIHPLHIVGINAMSPSRMCGLLLVRKDAPNFSSTDEAFAWLRGKVVGVPKGSCADRLGQVMLKARGVDVTWQQMQAEVIVTSLQASKVDAAVVYEPHASKAVFDGYARYAISSAGFNESDANTIVMRGDFVEKNRAAAVAWLKANIQALYFLRDRPVETVNFVKKELPDYSREVLWHAIYANPPAATSPSRIGFQAPMVVQGEGMRLLERGYAFLKENKVVQDPTLHPQAIMPELAVQAFKELGLDPNKGLFEIVAADASANPFKGDELVAKSN